MKYDGKEMMLSVTDPRAKEALFEEFGPSRDFITGLPDAYVTALACCEDSESVDEKWRRAEDVSDTEGTLDCHRWPSPPPMPKRRGLQW